MNANDEANKTLKIIKEYVSNKYGSKHCRYCGHYGCADFLYRATAIRALKTCGMLPSSGRFDRTWADIFSHVRNRLLFWELYCKINYDGNQTMFLPTQCFLDEMKHLFPQPDNLPSTHKLFTRKRHNLPNRDELFLLNVDVPAIQYIYHRNFLWY